MKKGLIIGGSVLGGLVLLVALLVGILMYVVLTPERLTPIVKQVAGDYITCDYDLERVELTVVKTFPQLGLEVKGLRLINKMQGAPNDTLAQVDKLVAAIDVKELLDNHVIDLKGIDAEGIRANIYKNEAGQVNYDVIHYESDTTDTTSSSWQLKAVNLNTIKLAGLGARYTDETLGVDAELQQGQLDVTGELTNLDTLAGQAKAHLTARVQARYAKNGVDAEVEDAQLDIDADVSDMTDLVGDIKAQLETPALTAEMNGVKYLDKKSASIDLPLHFNLNDMRFILDSTQLQLDQFAMNLKGWAEVKDTIDMDVKFGLNGWDVQPLLKMIPDTFQTMISGLKADGQLGVTGEVVGQYADSTLLPKLQLGLDLKDGKGSYEGIPYELRDVQAQMDLKMDLNNMEDADLHIRNLEAKTLNSKAEISGDINDVLGRTALDLLVNADVQISDFKDYIPNDIKIQGSAKGGFKVQGLLDDFTDLALEKTNITGQAQVKQFSFDMNDLHANTPVAQLGVQVPARGRRNAKAGWADLTVDSKELLASMDGMGSAALNDLNLDVQTCDLLNLGDNFLTNVNFKAKTVRAATDSLMATLQETQGNVDVDYDMTDTVGLPTINAKVKAQSLSALMDTLSVNATNPDVNVDLKSDSKDRSKMMARFNYDGGPIEGQMGSYASVTIQDVEVSGSAREKEVQNDNVLLQWNPRLKLKLKQADVNIADLTTQIQVPMIDMKYNNRHFQINDSRLIVGNSDFKLTGEVNNIAEWLSKEGRLTGELNFTSDVTDVNELMDLFSGSCVTDEALAADIAAAEANPDTTANPFLVPENTDITLHTKIKKAYISTETAHNLGGDLTVKDGVVVLEEMGFICEAARLQLTGMYKTPRMNHIFAGFDLHMLDINIENLINMIPEVDTLLPMLKSFQGQAEFHLALETYLDKYYNIKPSTALGAASISGKDLVLMDNQTFSKVAKWLMFRKKTENKVDSISAEITLWNKQVDVYPFVMAIDKYKAALGGRQNWNMTYDYHISLLSPLRLGVNVKTNKRGKLAVVPCLPKYAKDFAPERKNVVETENQKLRALISSTLKRNVK